MPAVLPMMCTCWRMNKVIIQSIVERRRLRFTYNGKARLAERQCYGIGAKGTELLRVHQIHGGSQREPLFDVSKMTNLALHEAGSELQEK